MRIRRGCTSLSRTGLFEKQAEIACGSVAPLLLCLIPNIFLSAQSLVDRIRSSLYVASASALARDRPLGEPRVTLCHAPLRQPQVSAGELTIMQPDPKWVGRPVGTSLSPAGEDSPRPQLPNLYYSIPHTGRLLDISKATVNRLIAAEKLDARKLLGKTVITGKSIEKLAAELPPSGARRTTADAAVSAAEPAQRPRQPEPSAGGRMGPDAHGSGPRLRRGRSRSLRHPRDRADEPAHAASSG